MIRKKFAAGMIGLALTLGACSSDTAEGNGEAEQASASNGTEETEEVNAAAEEATEETTEEPEAGKRSNPVAVGETHIVDVTIYDNESNAYEGKAEITINSVTRGEEAWEYVHSVNEYNEEPPEGQEYLIADVTAKLIEAETEDYAWFLDAMNFNFIGSDGSPYEWISTVVEPELSGEIYNGGTMEGKVANMVKKDDTILLVLEDSNFDNVFFATE